MTTSLPLQITVGVLCASYWRGAWYVLDYTMFPTDRVKSGLCSLTLGSGLLGMQQYMLSPSYNGSKFLVRLIPPPNNYSLRTYFIKMNRFVSLYGIAMACILVWRGSWLLWDEVADQVSNTIMNNKKTSENDNNKKNTSISRCGSSHERQLVQQRQPLVPLELSSSSSDITTDYNNNNNNKVPLQSLHHHHNIHDHAHHNHADHDAVSHHDIDETLFYSGIASHVFATVGLLLIGRFKSVMAPPANVSMMKDIFLHGKGKNFHRAAKSFFPS